MKVTDNNFASLVVSNRHRQGQFRSISTCLIYCLKILKRSQEPEKNNKKINQFGLGGRRGGEVRGFL